MIRLFAITDSTRHPDFVAQSEALCAGACPGSVGLVLRERGATGQQLYEWATALRTVTARWQQNLFVAERADLASLVGADGVHLPASGLRPGAIDPSLLVSRSGHGLEMLSAEDWLRLSFLWISPVIAERKGRAALKEEGLRHRIDALRYLAPHVASYALGGVESQDVGACQRAGAQGVAAIGAVWDPVGRESLLRELGILR